MLRLKLKLDEFEYIEGTPEELADFYRILGKQSHTEKSTRVKNVEIIDNEKPETKSATTEEYTKPISNLIEKSSLIESVKEEELIEFILPKEEEVIDYITSKELFEHHTVELQERFLGGRVRVRDNPTFYGSFDNIIRNVRKRIANKYNGTWNNKETKSLGGKTHVTIYRFEKSEEKQEDVNSPPKYFSIAKSKDLDTINV